ncbi:MAG: helix-turn-helix domain-containing protein [Nostochopsis sp.]
MNVEAAKVTVRAWRAGGILLERYTYTPGSVEPISKHSHNEYQFGLCLDWQGEYYYRGVWHQIPIGSLSVIHPGEVHAPSEKTYVPSPAVYWMMEAVPEILQAAFLEIGEKTGGLPFFENLFISDPEVAQTYLQLHHLMEHPVSQLEQDYTLLLLFTQLLSDHAQDCVAIAPPKAARPAVMLVREFLHAHYTENISLEQLAQVAELSRFHLCRIFRKEIGVPPHVYQMQIRINQAKKLLSQGIPIAEVTSLTGFYDQSHFSLHFKRLVGVTPRNYGNPI